MEMIKVNGKTYVPTEWNKEIGETTEFGLPEGYEMESLKLFEENEQRSNV